MEGGLQAPTLPFLASSSSVRTYNRLLNSISTSQQAP